MAFNATKLTEDLISANKAACEAVEKIEDGGSANRDSVFLIIPRARETAVLEAIKKAGLYCRAKRKWIGYGYMISPTSTGQGNKNSKGVDVMASHLRKAGWEVLKYEQMD